MQNIHVLDVPMCQGDKHDASRLFVEVRCFKWTGSKKFEPARGRTWNFLIRSQTRFHCATSPFRVIEFLNDCIDLFSYSVLMCCL